MYIDLCTIDCFTEYRIPSIRACKLSEQLNGSTRQLAIELDTKIQKKGIFVPEFKKIKNGIRLTYRNSPRFFSVIIRENSRYVEFIKSNLETLRVRNQQWALEQVILEMALYLESD